MSAPVILGHEDHPARAGAPAVLFVHGFPSDRRMWRRQIEGMAAHGARAIAADLRGFGASDDLPLDARAPFTMDDHADDLAALLDHLGVARAILVGLSMGGYIALAFVRRHKERLAGLLLSDTRAGADSPDAKRARDTNIELARREGSAAVFDAIAPRLFSPRSPREALAEMRAIAAAQPVDGVVAALRAMRDRPDATPVVASVAVPTEIVVGSDDQITPPSEAEAMARAIDGSRLTVIERAGHFPPIENPEAFAAPLLALVRG
jgi:pimeloyl-ACP methyl ester carboxylesterase